MAGAGQQARSSGVLPRPGLARGFRAHGRPCRALGDDLDSGAGCPRRARPAGGGRSAHHPGARKGAVGLDRDVDPGPRWHPDRPGRGSRRSPSPPRPAIGVTAKLTNSTLMCGCSRRVAAASPGEPTCRSALVVASSMEGARTDTAIRPVQSQPATHPPRVVVVRSTEPLVQEALLGGQCGASMWPPR
jgi:hypothetical protein